MGKKHPKVKVEEINEANMIMVVHMGSLVKSMFEKDAWELVKPYAKRADEERRRKRRLRKELEKIASGEASENDTLPEIEKIVSDVIYEYFKEKTTQTPSTE